MPATERERDFFDSFWTAHTNPITPIAIPTVDSLQGKRVLICSCGSGQHPVAAALEGAEVYTFDLSPVAVRKELDIARSHHLTIHADVMDFHELTYPDQFFDIIYGEMILHHVDCARVAKHLYRCLKPGGIAYFFENSDRNPILRLIRRTVFGKPGTVQRQRFLFFKRQGTPDEYPLTESEVAAIAAEFREPPQRFYDRLVFFETFSYVLGNPRILKACMQAIDQAMWLASRRSMGRWSFYQGLLFRKH